MAVHMLLKDNPDPSYKVLFSWNIDNFSTLKSGTTSPDFYPVPGSNTKWYLKIRFLKNLEVEEGALTGEDFLRHRYSMLLFLNRREGIDFPCDSGMRAEGKVSIDKLRDFLMQSEHTLQVTYQNLLEGGGCVLFSRNNYQFDSRECIPSECNDFVINVTMTVQGFSPCSQTILYKERVEGFLKIYSDNLATQIKHSKTEQSINCHDLVDDLRKMYLDNSHSDVVFQIGEQSLKAHKSVLSVRSPVFQKMFQHDMLEKNSGCILIVDFNLETFDKFLQFLYTGHVEADPKILMSLFSAADKYDVPGLRKTCLRALCSNLSVDTASTVLQLADREGDKKHKNKVIKFMKQHFSDVVCQMSWSELLITDQKLALEVAKK